MSQGQRSCTQSHMVGHRPVRGGVTEIIQTRLVAHACGPKRVAEVKASERHDSGGSSSALLRASSAV